MNEEAVNVSLVFNVLSTKFTELYTLCLFDIYNSTSQGLNTSQNVPYLKFCEKGGRQYVRTRGDGGHKGCNVF